MRNRSKLLISALAAITLLGLAVGGASARSLEISNSANGFRITWRPLRLEAGGNFIECPVTLAGNYERGTYAKVAGNRVGRVTVATVGTCERNHATALQETLPWEVTYNSFAGTLPTITSVTLNLLGASFRAETGTLTCLARTTSTEPARGIATIGAGGAITGFRADETAGIATSGGFFCSFGGPAHFAGSANSITERTGTAAITVRLI